jgi:hypothetical protein
LRYLAGQRPMTLASNDDGIHCEGPRALRAALAARLGRRRDGVVREGVRP